MIDGWKRYWLAYQELGSYEAVAKHFKVQGSTVRRAIKRAARRGEINLTEYQNPPGYTVSKSTVHTDAEGNVVQEWRRITPEAEDIEEWVDSLCDRAGRAGPKIKAPKIKGNLAGEIPIGDMHVGMMSWEPETGHNWDVDKSCKMFNDGSSHLMGLMPKETKHVILADLGDFLHSDNRHGTTEKSGNVLDMDGRFCRIIDKARDAWITAIEQAAENFASVHVIMAPGNHNPHASHWMARIVAAYFRKCKHVTIDTSPKSHRFHFWGKSLLGYTHGHLIKPPQLASFMAASCPAWWAESIHRHMRQGHLHHAQKLTHQDVEESHGVTSEIFPILPPKDAYHAERGYESRRLMQAILHHEEHGEITRHTVHARMLEK